MGEESELLLPVNEQLINHVTYSCRALCVWAADILRVMPSKAIELAAFDAYKKLLSHTDPDGKLMRPGPLLTGLAGAMAGNTIFSRAQGVRVPVPTGTWCCRLDCLPHGIVAVVMHGC